MSVSIYYSAERGYSLTNQEKELIKETIGKYIIGDRNKVDWRGENLNLYDYKGLETPIVLEGSVEIGNYTEDYEREIEEVVRWCYCLTDIRRNIEDLTWKVIFGDELLSYDEEIGFHMRRIPKSLHVDLKPKID